MDTLKKHALHSIIIEGLQKVPLCVGSAFYKQKAVFNPKRAFISGKGKTLLQQAFLNAGKAETPLRQAFRNAGKVETLLRRGFLNAGKVETAVLHGFIDAFLVDGGAECYHASDRCILQRTAV